MLVIRWLYIATITIAILSTMHYVNAGDTIVIHGRCVVDNHVLPCKLVNGVPIINGKHYKSSDVRAVIMFDGKLNMIIEEMK